MSHFILLLCLLTNLASSHSHHDMSQGTTLTPLTPPTSWLSPSGNFAFGFRPLDTDPALFLLSVWFNKIANKTVVWTANGDNPLANGSKAVLTYGGQLSLKDAASKEVWDAGVSNVSHASMLDTGNFVLLSAESAILWQSFGHPTDTMMPGQVLNKGNRLYARILDNDHARGRFELSMQEDGNLVLYPLAYPSQVRYPEYWSSGTAGAGLRLVFNESGSIFLSLQNDKYIAITSGTDMGDRYYLRATLDPDGIFRQYYTLKEEVTTGTWEVLGRIDVDVCQSVTTGIGSGACGFNSYCTMDTDGNVDCRCPSHYSFIDPKRRYKGCAPDFTAQSCEPGGEAQFDLTPMPHLDWPSGDGEQLSPMNETECRANCLKDCFCAVAVYTDLYNGTCWKKKFPLSNGRSNINGKSLIKYSLYNSPDHRKSGPAKNKRDWSSWDLIGSLLLGGSVVLNLAFVIFYVYRKTWQRPPSGASCMSDHILRSFGYKDLEQATKCFSEEIGRGSFGVVYKGVLASEPRIPVAVKKLQNLSEDAEKFFTNEVATIGQTHHKNLVRLLGFCREGAHRLLVFEFMSNGSLNKFLFGCDQPPWNQRVQIALGVAGGLAYLHEECRTQIIHCDIKPQNILLDANYGARISDFGLAKLLRLEQTRTSTGIRGTIGYFAPEWFKNVAITTRVDVYSYGVMMLEIICCKRNFEWGSDCQARISLTDFAKECYRNGRLDLLVEEDEDAKNDLVKLERFVMVAISCIQDEPLLRPSMKKVVQMLEGTTSVDIPSEMHTIHS